MKAILHNRSSIEVPEDAYQSFAKSEQTLAVVANCISVMGYIPEGLAGKRPM